jgi:hypothetical protein
MFQLFMLYKTINLIREKGLTFSTIQPLKEVKAANPTQLDQDQTETELELKEGSRNSKQKERKEES